MHIHRGKLPLLYSFGSVSSLVRNERGLLVVSFEAY